MTPEKIAAAALQLDDMTISAPPPARHHTLIHAIDKYLPEERLILPTNQGFITNTGRFVNRREAAAIAFEAAQVTKLEWPHAGLHSEDLW